MGYSPIRTQPMSVPPYAATFVVAIAIPFLADRWGQRGYRLFFSGIVGMVGYILFLTSTNTSVLHGSIFLQTTGALTSASAVGTWNIKNVRTTNAPLPSGLDRSWSTLGDVLSTWIFNDPPRFRNATKFDLAFSFGVCVLAAVN